MKTLSVLCLLAEGFEEIEALTPVDLLRRAECEVVLAAISENHEVRGKHGIVVKADDTLSQISALHADGKTDFDMLLIPGGPAVSQLRRDGRAAQLAAAYAKAGVWVAAICAGPTVLLDAGLLKGRRFTAHFSVKEELPETLGGERVVVDGNLITSRGPGTALDFGLALVQALMGPQKREEIAASIMA
ncbi:MAG: DJ-1 family protein [Verrucomicrobia bacterium]|nr:MAG: DJ-1 family protein [Verrucomicrobiota bacterium]